MIQCFNYNAGIIYCVSPSKANRVSESKSSLVSSILFMMLIVNAKLSMKIMKLTKNFIYGTLDVTQQALYAKQTDPMNKAKVPRFFLGIFYLAIFQPLLKSSIKDMNTV